MSAPELKPCPFCGEMPKVHLFDQFGGAQIDCITTNCPASPITSGNALGDPLVAFTAWNTRAPDPRVLALVEALRWYGEQSRLARLIHSEGDAGRNAIASDGGGRARAALAAWEA